MPRVGPLPKNSGRKPRASAPVCPFCGCAMRRLYHRLEGSLSGVCLIIDYAERGRFGYWYCVGVKAGRLHPIHVAQTPE